MTKLEQVKISLLSLHGLIRARDPELGRDADTGGQVKYVLELAAELSRHPQVREVELITRQIIDPRIGPEYSKVEEPMPGRLAITVSVPGEAAHDFVKLSETGWQIVGTATRSDRIDPIYSWYQ